MPFIRFLVWFLIVIALIAGGIFGWLYLNVLYPIHYEAEIRTAISETWGEAQVAEREPFVLAVIRSESDFDPGAHSAAGAVGLMQLIPSTAQEVAQRHGVAHFAVSELTDPAVNLKLGTLYLKELLENFHDDTELVLTGYNGGPGLANYLEGGQSVATETQAYIAAVKRREAAYRRRLQLYRLIHY